MHHHSRAGHRAVSAAAGLLAATLALTACGNGGGSTSPQAGDQHAKADQGAFPVKVTTKFGTATVKAPPKRVVALGWSDQDVALALGVKPVAIVKTEDGFTNGVGPWAQKALGDARPQVLDTTDGYPIEKIAALHPDLILGVQSGLTSADYGKLSKIAPTVAYQAGRQAYGTPWQEQTKLIGEALGRGKEAEQAIAGVQQGLAEDRKKYPALAGKTFVYAFPQQSNGRLVLYTDERTKILQDVGMKLDPVVGKAAGMNSFSRALSMENLGEVTSDAMLVWYLTPADQKQFESGSVFKKLPSVRGHAYIAVDRTLAQATSAPSVLNISWSTQRLLPTLAKSLR